MGVQRVLAGTSRQHRTMATFTGTHEIPTEASAVPGEQRSGADTAQAAVAIGSSGGRENNDGDGAA